MSEPAAPDPTAPPRGHLMVIHGCMFAGKTARLIERLIVEREKGSRVLALKHRLDARYDAEQISTHDGRRFPARSVATADAFHDAAVDAAAEVVGLDEAHFFGRPLLAVCERLLVRGVSLILAGIDNDAWGQPFTPMPELAARADEDILLCAPCRVCGEPARFSQRMIPLADDDMVGGITEYEPRCPAHFQPLTTAAPVY